jgi:hypothetical protein
MGVKTRQFDQMNTFYRDVLNLDILSMAMTSLLSRFDALRSAGSRASG